MASSYSHFSLEGVIDQRPINSEQTQLLVELSSVSRDLGSLKQLLADSNPKIRTLALGAIFQREAGRDLPLIASLLDDTAPTFPDLHESASSIGGERPLSEMETPQTVNEVVEAMLTYWGVEHRGMPAGRHYGGSDLFASDFRVYWKQYESVNESADWFAVRLNRATRHTIPIQQQYEPDIERVLQKMKALPEPIRSLTELYVLTPQQYCETEAEDCVVSSSFLIAEERKIGPATLLKFLEHQRVWDDPALVSYGARNRLAPDFILRHADQLLRAEDAPQLLECENNIKDRDSAIDPAWVIGAALLQPNNASAMLRAKIAKRTGYDEDTEWASALWQIRGKEETPFLVGWFYGPHGSSPEAQRTFLYHVQSSQRPDTPQLLAALVRDARFGQTSRGALIQLVNLANIGRATPVVDQMGSGASWPSRYNEDCTTINGLRNSLRLAYGVSAKDDCEITSLGKALRDLPSHDAEITLSFVSDRGNPMIATYEIPKAKDKTNDVYFGHIEVKVSTYTSPEEARSELKRIATLKSFALSQSPKSGLPQLFESKQQGEVMAQVGSFVFETKGAFPYALKVSEALIPQLEAVDGASLH